MNVEGIIGHQKQIKYLEFLLNSEKIPQAILFTGIPGIGKSLIANRFLNSFFCKNADPPCLSCPICKQIANKTFPDFIEIHPNERDIIPIGGEETQERGSIRWLIRRLSSKSISGKFGIIINGTEKITEEGQNALIKTIEEPSTGTCFILITSNKNNLLPTIQSRCSEIRFSPLPDHDLKEIICKNNLPVEDLDMTVKISAGSTEAAEIISDPNKLNKIIEICKAISSFLTYEKFLDIDIGSIQNKIKTEILLSIIINIYRLNLLSIIKHEKEINPQLKQIFVYDEKKILNLLKILILLKRNESFNLNIKYAIKGLLYYFATGIYDSLSYMGLAGELVIR